jgi:hypothetical protein
MADEVEIADVTFANVGLNNFATPRRVVVLDVANSTNTISAVGFPAGAGGQPLGVSVDKTKLTPAATVPAGEGLAVRIWGIVKVEVSAAVAAGAFVANANALGQVVTQAKAIAGAQPLPIVGYALTSAAGVGEQIRVLLMIGGMF